MSSGTGDGFQSPFEQRRGRFEQNLNSFFSQQGFGGALTGGGTFRQRGIDAGFLNAQGGLIGGFDFNRFNSDAAYREFIEQSAGRGGFGEDLTQVVQGAELAGANQRIDIGAIFDPLGQKIDEQAASSLQSGRAEINRQAQGAETRAVESLAGTGLGRSGVAAQSVGEIGRARIDAGSRLQSQVETARNQAQINLAFKQAELEYSEQLQQRGFTQEQIVSAIQFDRQLYALQFQSDLQPEPGLFDDIISVVGLGVDIATVL